MTHFIIKYFIENEKYNTTKDATSIRKRYGIVSGYVGIFCNIVLFFIKLFAGIITHSISITADAFNNLSDAGSSIATVLGFQLAEKSPDKEHPFGHGRYEYIAGFIVSIIIILMGVELLKASVEKIFFPQEVIFHTSTIIILSISIIIKIWLSIFNQKIGKIIQSSALKATAMDSFSDVIATIAVIIGVLINHFFSVNVDGYIGVIVAIFIFYTGITTAKDTLDPLIGTAPDKKFIEDIKKFILSYDDILGIHDLIVHSYGAEKKLISLHAEVSAHENILKIHNCIDDIERSIKQKFCCDAVIHMDPIDTEDENTKQLYQKVKVIVFEIDKTFQIHDFRVITNEKETKIFFDVTVPFQCKETDISICNKIKKEIEKMEKDFIVEITIDHLDVLDS